ncbi:hypothetical protein I4U23_009683 [Adineta vaga]|nr:hypothetical protein I4U23_009683 [Adineta vaga]
MANSSSNEHLWFKTYHPRPFAKYQVFIFPSAGNPGSYFREWDRQFPEYEFSLIIYPGRATRSNENLITSIAEYLKQLDKGLVPFINKPCVFIGHSLGCVISFALAKHMIETNNKGNLIRLMIQMARGPPHIKVPYKSFTEMTDTELANDLRNMADPSTKHIYDYPEYIEMLLPILRADGQVGYELIEKTQLNIPIIVYGGDKDTNREPLLHSWIELTTAEDLFRVRMFSGHHHFPSENAVQVLQYLKEDINNFVKNSNNN